MAVDLRSRLSVVAAGDWVTIGSDVLRDAQTRLRLSNYKLASMIPVSERTWTRWREAGRVPVEHVDNVAEVLHLELERIPPKRIRVGFEQGSAVERFADAVEVFVAGVARLEKVADRLEAELEPPAAPGTVRNGQ